MQTFELTHEHITLLRAASVGWNKTGCGSPTIEPTRPYGVGRIFRVMASVLNIEWEETDDGAMPPDLCTRLLSVHIETATALQIVLATGAFEVGVYEADDCRRNWCAV